MGPALSAFSVAGAATTSAVALGSDRSPSWRATSSGPATAPSGTRTSTTLRLRRNGAAATSSAAPSAPRNTTSYVRPSARPRMRTSEPVLPLAVSWQARMQRHECSTGAGRTLTPNGGAESCGALWGAAGRGPARRLLGAGRTGKREGDDATGRDGADQSLGV